MATTSYSCVIRVSAEQRPTNDKPLWILKSEDLPGMLLAGPDLPPLLADVPVAIQVLFRENYGMEVTVLPVASPREVRDPMPILTLPATWTAIPAAA